MGDVALAVLTLGAWVFAVSAGSKLRGRRAYRGFVAGLRETGLIPARALPATAALLAGGEALIAAILAVLAVVTGVAGEQGVLPAAQGALACAAALTAMLAAGVAATIRSGARARCACFGARAGRPLGRAHLARNAGLLAVLVTGLVACRLAHGQPVPAAAALAAATGSLAALVIIRWEDLADLFVAVPGAAASPRHPAETARAPPPPRAPRRPRPATARAPPPRPHRAPPPPPGTPRDGQPG